MTLSTLFPADTRAAIDAGARLIDIRGADEHLREVAAGKRAGLNLGRRHRGVAAGKTATVADRSQPLEIMRQVQIVAGALVLSGVGWGSSWRRHSSACRHSRRQGRCSRA